MVPKVDIGMKQENSQEKRGKFAKKEGLEDDITERMLLADTDINEMAKMTNESPTVSRAERRLRKEPEKDLPVPETPTKPKRKRGRPPKNRIQGPNSIDNLLS